MPRDGACRPDGANKSAFAPIEYGRINAPPLPDMIRFVLLLTLFLYGQLVAAETGGDSPLRWRQRTIGWRRDGRRYSAWTSWRARRNGDALEADITLFANIFDDYRKRGLNPRPKLYKSLVHEFGHVLGLGHSVTPEDAMSVGVRTRPEWTLPSANDVERCRERYPVL